MCSLRLLSRGLRLLCLAPVTICLLLKLHLLKVFLEIGRRLFANVQAPGEGGVAEVEMVLDDGYFDGIISNMEYAGKSGYVVR
jgi:hypothetical protein